MERGAALRYNPLMDTSDTTGGFGKHAAPSSHDANMANMNGSGVGDRAPADAQARRTIEAASVAAFFARVAVCAVFVANVMCALQFFIAPAASAAAYGLSTDYATQAIVAGLGVAFLMWNCTYPAVIASPIRFRGLFVVVLVQQLVGLVGESVIRIRLVEQGMHDSAMIAGIDQFILWDAGGLLAMGVTFAILMVALHRRNRQR